MLLSGGVFCVERKNNRDCLHIKSALSYCESTVKHTMGEDSSTLTCPIYTSIY